MYRERPSVVPGAQVWTNGMDPVAGGYRVLPDGCMDLLWVGGELLVAGPDRRAYLVAARAPRRYTGLRFPPGVAPAVLGVAADELRDQRVALDQLWPAARVRELTGRLAEAEAPGRVLEEWALRAGAATPDRWGGLVVAGLRAGLTVAELADQVGLGARQLHRRSLLAFGYGPKTLGRILRFDRAVALARAGVPFAAVAAEAGYADQPHLAREVRSLAGVGLGQLVGSFSGA